METGPTRVAFLGGPPDEGRIMDRRRPHIVALGVVPMFGVASARADAAIAISRAELSGTQLRVEGSGAVPNHAVTVSPGSVPGTSDANGAFKLQKDPYGSPTRQDRESTRLN